jgi:signal transduction histidine kinase
MDLLPTDLGQASSRATTSTNPPMTGFYGTRGVVTFNDRVFDKEYLYVQEDSASVLVSLQDRHFKNEFKAGQCLELGGALLPGRAVPVIHPLAVTELGWRAMPMPVSQPAQLPIPESSEGKWTEVEGVAHRVQANDTLAVMGKAGPISVWIGQAASNYLGRYVDARLRVRGVLTLPAPDAPLLLVPSRSFVDVEEEARTDPFAIPVHAIRDLTPATLDPSSLHRIRLVGEVTYRNGLSLVIQDESGGAWVQSLDEPPVKIGDAVEVVGFPAAGGGFLTVTEALVRPSNARRHVEPAKLDLSEALSSKQSGKLVRVTASLLIQKTVGFHQILEVQEQRRVFAAMLSRDNGTLPTIAPGSRVTITGVCDNGGVALRASGQLGGESLPLGSLRVLLRGPGDVAVLSGPPWWTLKRTLTLVGALLTVLAVALLWVQLLRRRLARQHTARLAFSRQILQGQESERQRIALNLHDSLGQNLLVIKHQARLAMDPTTDASERQKRLNDISEITSQALEEVRQITHDLRPYQLDRLGLTQAIRATVSRAAESSSIQFASHVDDIDALFNKEAEIHLYRVIQEAVNNILKHSSATEAAVVVKNQTARVSVSVRDNGCGFDPPAADFAHSRNVGYGLKGMTERVRILGGSLLINSGPARGTSLTVELPKPSVR